MIGLKSLLDYVCIEAIVDWISPEEQKRMADSFNLLPIHYVVESEESSSYDAND
ncbi:MAG: hypothetical protein KKF50_04995 [Nanoarchaeota archaeon]|nr:hypothetical protein [Nanoarchaeota archaeon]